MPPGARPPGLLGLRVPDDAQTTRASADLAASYNLTDDGIRLLSASAREFQLTRGGLRAEAKTPARGASAVSDEQTAPNHHHHPAAESAARASPSSSSSSSPHHQLSYRVSSSDVRAFSIIGAGAGGSVRRAVHVPAHRFCALKTATVFERNKRRQLVQELKALCDSPKEPHIVRFFGAYYAPETNQIHVCLEYVDGGSLDRVVARAGRAPARVLGRVARGVAEGVAFLHDHLRLAHRDVKPSNILIRRTGEPKITDFGIVGDLRGTKKELLDSFKGTMCYMSPERCENRAYGRAADVWSVGIALLECAVGRYPYDVGDGGPVGLMMQIANDPTPVPERKDPEFFPPGLERLVLACTRKDPETRPTAREISLDPWVAEQMRVVPPFRGGGVRVLRGLRGRTPPLERGDVLETLPRARGRPRRGRSDARVSVPRVELSDDGAGGSRAGRGRHRRGHRAAGGEGRGGAQARDANRRREPRGGGGGDADRRLGDARERGGRGGVVVVGASGGPRAAIGTAPRGGRRRRRVCASRSRRRFSCSWCTRRGGGSSPGGRRTRGGSSTSGTRSSGGASCGVGAGR